MSDRGIRCGESDAGRAMRRSGWHSAVSSTLVSRSRAMPVGDRRSSPPAFSWSAIRDLAARRAAVPGFRAPARCRSETGAPLFRGWRSATSLCVEQRCRVSRSRAMPVGDRRSAFSRLAMRDLAARRAAVPVSRSRAMPVSALPARGWRCAISLRVAQRCWFRAPARCRSETGAPLFRGWRCAISRCVAQRCRVSRSRAMPVGDRRSAFSRLAMRDLAARRAAVPGFALPRDAGRRPALRFFVVGDPRVAQRCRVSRSRAMPVGDRRSAFSRRCAISLRVAPVPVFPRDAGRASDARSRCASRAVLVSRSRAMPVGDRRSAFSVAIRSRSGAGFRAPARSETGAPLFRVAQRCRVSRSRAMPVGDRRSAFSRLAMRDLAARRAAVPGFALPRDAGRRPALRFFARWRCAISLCVAQRCRVSRSRAMPVGDRRSFAVGDAPSGQLGSPGARGIRKKPS